MTEPRLNRLQRFRPTLLAAGVLGVLAVGLAIQQSRATNAPAVPSAVLDEAPKPGGATEVAVLAGGCFWGVQGVFQHVAGVTNAVSGYTGGDKLTAQYNTVSTGGTGHAESVQITYDPHKITYARILQIYFSAAHNPTELNHQGADMGTQYRSAIFPSNAEQTAVARAYIAQLDQARVFDRPIVTKIEPDKTFYPAEGYHQDYLTLHPEQPYIAYNDLPKLRELQRLFPELYRSDPVLVAASKPIN